MVVRPGPIDPRLFVRRPVEAGWRTNASDAAPSRVAFAPLPSAWGGLVHKHGYLGRRRSASSSTRSTTSRAQAVNASTSPPPGSTTSSQGASSTSAQVEVGDPLGQRSGVVGQLAVQPLQRAGAGGGVGVLPADPGDVLGGQTDHQRGLLDVVGPGLAAAVRGHGQPDRLEAGPRAPAHRQPVDRQRPGRRHLDVGQVVAQHGAGDHRAGGIAGAEDQQVVHPPASMAVLRSVLVHWPADIPPDDSGGGGAGVVIAIVVVLAVIAVVAVLLVRARRARTVAEPAPPPPGSPLPPPRP